MLTAIAKHTRTIVWCLSHLKRKAIKIHLEACCAVTEGTLFKQLKVNCGLEDSIKQVLNARAEGSICRLHYDHREIIYFTNMFLPP